MNNFKLSVLIIFGLNFIFSLKLSCDFFIFSKSEFEILSLIKTLFLCNFSSQLANKIKLYFFSDFVSYINGTSYTKIFLFLFILSNLFISIFK